MSRTVNVLAMVRDGQRYVFLYDDLSIDALRRQFAEFAEDPELDFTWLDAATLSRRVRQMQDESEELLEEDTETWS
ncbi:MAG: hypothetical protein RL215_1767 [Planctomycetota bacterium]|jgi:hypothetical protein